MYNVMESPGLGAFFAGQKHAADQRAMASRLATEELMRQKTLQDLMFEQERRPLILEEQRQRISEIEARTQQARDKLSAEETARRQKAITDFFNYMRKYDDVEGAIEFSGVPRKFAEKYLTLSPAQREELYNNWINRELAPERAKTRIKTDAEKEQIGYKINLETKKAREMKELDLQRALAIKMLELENKLALAQMRLSQINNQNYQQYIVSLSKQLNEVKKMPETTLEQKEAKARAMEEVVNTMNAFAEWEWRLKEAAAMANQIGKPDVGALTQGQVPTHQPQPVPQLGSRLAGQPPQGADPIPQSQKYIPGQIYKGKTGTYKFLGLPNVPETDRRNWEKVD